MNCLMVPILSPHNATRHSVIGAEWFFDGRRHGTLHGTLETAKRNFAVPSREAAVDCSRGWSGAEPPGPQKTNQAPKERQIDFGLVNRQGGKKAGGCHVQN